MEKGLNLNSTNKCSPGTPTTPEPLAAAASYSEATAPALDPKPETVTISRGEYGQLLTDQAKLRALEAMGVDNWSGYSDAMEQLAA
ncbi:MULTISPECIES: hypothetical protein [unclassified Halomonas]|uniref:hypothetical protein n=1 Tax=unclassified Halomonas TaxID=2609666 RepID=UPI001CF25A29|nr:MULTISPECIES: hypothetical protein [unclassified Halomonas]UZH12252.1 hypothetical protein OM794_11180 [Halomonas sp. BDJS001]